MPTKIQWTHGEGFTGETWNPITGCTRASSGCDHCYSAALSKRLAAMGQEKYQGIVGNGHFNGVVKTWDDELAKPLKWRKPRMIFVNSMSDTFHKDVPFEFIDKMFAVMALCRKHTFQVLTKRPERALEYLTMPDICDRIEKAAIVISLMQSRDRPRPQNWRPPSRRRERELIENRMNTWPMSQVWLGTSCEDQQTADERIPHLLRCPAAVRFLSCEPLLKPIDLTPWFMSSVAPIHWVIVGGESGPKARPCNVEWICSVVEQCKAAGVACFVKQLGAMAWSDTGFDETLVIDGQPIHGCDKHWWNFNDRKGGDPSEWPASLRIREFPSGAKP